MLVTGLGSSVLGKPTVNSAYNTLVSCVLKWTNKSDIRKKKKKARAIYCCIIMYIDANVFVNDIYVVLF